MAGVQVPLRVWLGAVVAVAWLLPSEGAEELRVRFIGNMAFAITDGTTTVMTDFPYRSGFTGYMTYDASEIRAETPTTIALITHRHPDHWDSALFQRTNWQVIGPSDVTGGLPADRRLDPAAAPGGIRVDVIATPHGGIGHQSYLLTWLGRRLFFTGDTESLDVLTAARNLDAAFVSPWLFAMALDRKLAIDAKRIVIYHHQAGETVPGCAGRCVVPRQGDTLRF